MIDFLWTGSYKGLLSEPEDVQLSTVPTFIPSFLLPPTPSPVFQHYYHAPTFATTNTTALLLQINEILEKANNQTGTSPGNHNGTVTPPEHALIFLPESLVLCTRERPVLCLLLMLGTLWLGYALYLIKRRYVHLLHRSNVQPATQQYKSKSFFFLLMLSVI